MWVVGNYLVFSFELGNLVRWNDLLWSRRVIDDGLSAH